MAKYEQNITVHVLSKVNAQYGTYVLKLFYI